MKTVFVEPERCIGCRHCEIVCALVHSRTKNILTFASEYPPPFPRIHVELGYEFMTFPSKCRHCDPAPCMQVCPTGAIYKDDETGSILVNYEKCIACAMCAMVCPFDVITFRKIWNVRLDHEVNAKCDHCIDRQRRGEIPACVRACKTGALIFGDANDIIRNARKDFTLRTTKAVMGEEAPAIPKNVEEFREVMSGLLKLSPLA